MLIDECELWLVCHVYMVFNQSTVIHFLEGYGDKLINAYQSMKHRFAFGNNQSNKIDFPLILGRDFCGEIVRKGPRVTKFNLGDKVNEINILEN
jgi:hypothetical protein